jgi:hypothetical protein
MGEVRNCEQCGALFTPRREHARFCSAACRVAWNQEKLTDAPAEVTALQWSVGAMTDTADQLPWVRPGDRPRACELIGETVWWITIVDATLVRYHPDAYDHITGNLDPAERRQIEGTLAGLRFVRNRMRHDVNHGDFILPAQGQVPVPAWTWKPVPVPPLTSLLPRGQEWEMTRYRAYQTHLAGHAVGEIFSRATGFLRLIAGSTVLAAESGLHAAM